MLDPNIKLARQPGFGAFIRELAEAPLDEINAKLGARPDNSPGDLRRGADAAPYKFIPTLLPLSAGTSTASQVEDRRLRMLADTRDAFSAFDSEQDDAPQESSRTSPSQAAADRPAARQTVQPEGIDALMRQPQALQGPEKAKETAPANLVDPQLQNVLLSLATASSAVTPRPISTTRTVLVSIAATLLVMAAAWAAVRLL